MGIHHLGAAALAEWHLPLAPLSEQHRIVEAIEAAFSKLDAGVGYLEVALARLARLEDSVYKWLADEAARMAIGWEPLSGFLELSIGGVWGNEPGAGELDVLVFRVTELRPDGSIDPSTAACRSITRAQFESRALRAGDLLLEKSGGGPNRPVGRVGLVGPLHVPAACANFMQLMRPMSSIVSPVFLHMLLTAFHRSGQTVPLQTATTNIRNLKTKDYLATKFPVLGLDAQRSLTERVAAELDAIGHVGAAIRGQLSRAAVLRRAALAAAFYGRLVPQNPNDEPARLLLDRIDSERAASEHPARTRRPRTAETGVQR